MKFAQPPRAIGHCLVLAGAGMLLSCAPEPLLHGAPAKVAKDMTPIAAPADFPGSYYLQAEADGKNVLRIDARQSLVVIEVRRGGTLARLGHDHVVASRDVAGYVLPEAGRADLYLALAQLSVDEPRLRTEAGFEPQPPQSAIDGTRRNMLEKVLEAERFPFASIHIRRNAGDPSTLAVSIVLHGMRRNYQVPAHIESDADGMRIDGRIGLEQSDFGIVPFSVLGGALQVQDHLDLHFHIVATPAHRLP